MFKSIHLFRQDLPEGLLYKIVDDNFIKYSFYSSKDSTEYPKSNTYIIGFMIFKTYINDNLCKNLFLYMRHRFKEYNININESIKELMDAGSFLSDSSKEELEKYLLLT